MKAVQDINSSNADTPGALTALCPQHKYAMLDDGMGNAVIQKADAWTAAYYHAQHP